MLHNKFLKDDEDKALGKAGKEKSRTPRAQAAKNLEDPAAPASAGEAQKSPADLQAEREKTSDLFIGGLEQEVSAAETGVEAAKTASAIGMSEAIGAMGGDPTQRMGARESAAMTIEAQQRAGEDIAEAEMTLGETEVQAAEDRLEAGHDPLTTEAKAEAMDMTSTWNKQWDAIKDANTHFYGNSEGKAYNEMMEVLDKTAQDVFGGSIRGGDPANRALWLRIKDLAKGIGEGTAREKEMAKAIVAQYNTAQKNF